MKLTFFGAAKTVTGSCHCLDINGKRILIDCGLQQGRDAGDNSLLQFAPNTVDYVIVTHAHIDHSGRIPLLSKLGFSGEIITTRLTAQLLSIMLRDSAHIQESDAQWENQKGKRAGREPVEPLYTLADAETALGAITHYEYGDMIDICTGVRIRFVDAGHLLGSASIEIWLTEGDETRKIVFSGDIGNIDQPIIRDPQYIQEADYVVMESTYGDRLHKPPEDYRQALAAIIDETFSNGGNVIIPSFAVGRTQELLYFMREMKEEGMVRTVPNFEVCVDSPLANEATRIFAGDLRGYLDADAEEIIRDGEALFTFPGLKLVQTAEDSKLLNAEKTSKVIISASGMCDAGRIRHHLKHNLWRPECTVIFVGYQGEGTLGRALLNGITSVKLFGEEITVRAKIVNFQGLSSHADRDHLIAWVEAISPKPKQVFVVHGDTKITDIFSQTLRDRGFSAHAPLPEGEYDLISGSMLYAGVERKPKPTVYHTEQSPAYRQLELALSSFNELVHNKRGYANRDLNQMRRELENLLEKWK